MVFSMLSVTKVDRGGALVGFRASPRLPGIRYTIWIWQGGADAIPYSAGAVPREVVTAGALVQRR
jgi:hypothetical protein